jgi:glycosidase
VKLPSNPLVHEIFTWVWLQEVGRRIGRTVGLGDVPDDVWDDVAGRGVDAVWLMGVWERSPRGAAIAREPSAMDASRAVLPDVTDDDIVGSAYCIRNYRVDDRLGGDAGLQTARTALAARGVGLILDFVPNHVAPDHPWAAVHPEYFVHGAADDLARDPKGFMRIGEHVFACGRDPYFPAWSDVLQLDASRADLRHAATDVVLTIADRCDGVRCDMAMLVLDDVFARTWGERGRGGSRPGGDHGYWPPLIDAVRASHPDFAFWAEAYWDLEPTLVGQGFDACYDKRLYDRLVHGAPASSIREHVAADLEWQRHTLRFAENHDEPRLASVLDPQAARAVALVSLTLPGVALLHHGQSDGRRVRIPVTLGRGPVEPVDAEQRAWYSRLMHTIGSGMRRGAWAVAGVEGWPDNRSCDHLVAWTWSAPPASWLVVVNLSNDRADGRVRWPGLHSSGTLVDTLTGERYERDVADIQANGLYVALPPHGAHLLATRSDS